MKIKGALLGRVKKPSMNHDLWMGPKDRERTSLNSELLMLTRDRRYNN